MESRKDICKRSFKSIPFVSTVSCVISQTELFHCVTTMVPQKLVDINERGDIKMSSNYLFKISCATSKSMSFDETRRGLTMEEASKIETVEDKLKEGGTAV